MISSLIYIVWLNANKLSNFLLIVYIILFEGIMGEVNLHIIKLSVRVTSNINDNELLLN